MSSLLQKSPRSVAITAAVLGIVQIALISLPVFLLWPPRDAQAIVCSNCVNEATFNRYIALTTKPTITTSIKSIVTALSTGGTLSQLVKDAAEEAIRRAEKIAFNALKQQLLNMIVNDIVRWINGQGKPRFVTNWQGFLKTAGDNAAGRVLDELGGGFLCEPFSVQIRILLAPVKKFPERARCSISDVVKNVDSFFQNFRNGGWRAWITVSTQPQNNIYGTYLLAVDERAQQEAAAKEAAQAEAESSQGFLSQKVCTQFHVRGSTIPVYGEFKAEELGPDAICDKFEIRTPGSTAGNLLSKALGLGPDSLVSAKEFEEYLGAIVNAAINRVIREGLATIGVKTPPITAAGPDVFPPESVNLAGESAIAPQLVLAQNNLRTTLQDQLIPAEATLVTRLFTLEDTQRRTLIAVQQLNDNACQLPDFAKKEVVGGEVIITAEGIGKLTVAGGKAVNPEAFATAQITTISQTSTQQSQQVETFLPIASGTVEQYIVKLKEYTRSLGSSREKALLNETLAARTIAFNNSRDAIFSAINDSNFFLRNDGGPSIFTETQNDAAAAQERVTQIQERIGDENANTGIFGEIASAREKRATADQLLASCIPTPTTVPATRITP